MRLTAACLLASAVLLAGCSGGGSDPEDATPPVTKEIAMHGGMYEPDRVTVNKGDTLRFAAHDTMHSAKTMDGSYDAGDIAQGTEKDVVMGKAGTFVFKCRFHGAMQLTATVNA